MPITLVEPVETIADAYAGPRRKKWTRQEIHALAQAGGLDIERLELIDGELFDKMGKKLPHIQVLHALVELLGQMFGIDRVVQESSVEVAVADQATNEPEPDVVVLNRSLKLFTNLPESADVCLVAEVSDSSLRFDLGPKARLYARAGIVEYWVADVNGRRLIVHREPSQGQYRSVVAYDVTESIATLTAPGVGLAVKSIFS